MVMKPSLLIEGDQGSQWNRGFVHIPEQHQPFQIVFRGSLKGIRGDIAVDDVNIFFCSQLTTPAPTSAFTTEDSTFFTTVAMLKLQHTSQQWLFRRNQHPQIHRLQLK
ncbi:hypothetical protein Btru_076220 [Bulinus truncatus]|nr:hypothetical protein Btru_076220 [Bulinus truncatus]